MRAVGSGLKDFTADEVAAAFGVSPRWIKAIRNGKREPSDSLQVALLQFLIDGIRATGAPYA